MGFNIGVSVSAFTVFLQGVVSFFSPCVLPLVPLYIGYLAGGTRTVEEDGTVRYGRGKVLLNTLFFVIGISFAFFLLGLGVTAAGQVLSENRTLFARIGGILIILLGLWQLGVFGSSRLLSQEHRLPFRLDRFAMNPLVALLLGFTFSFAWTPCVGPALASVLLMASSASTTASGFVLIGIYTLGFVLPFLAVGLFTTTVLDFFRTHAKVVKYTVKVGGALLVLMGVMMFTGWMNGVTGYLSQFGATGAQPAASSSVVSSSVPQATAAPADSNANSADSAAPVPAPDFTLVDQNGETHTLSDYKGKVVFLNFWATWCPPCQDEMPDIEALYEDQGLNANDVVVLGIANPKTDGYPNNSDGTVQDVTDFLSKNNYTYPVVMDTTGEMFSAYGITAFPTTFMIDKDGNIFGYARGGLTRAIMDSIVQQTLSGKRS